MATIQYRLSTRHDSRGNAQVMVRFYDGNRAFRAKSRILCPVSLWDSTVGMPVVNYKRMTAKDMGAAAARMKLDQISATVLSRWLEEKANALDGWLQDVIDDITIRKK